MGLLKALERESDFEVVWELSSANTIDVQLRRHPVDLVLMDVSMGPGKDGIAATRELTEKWPRVKVVVISASFDDGRVLASSRAGANGFLPKDLPISEMISSIRRLAVGLDSMKAVPGDLLDAMHRNQKAQPGRRGRRANAGMESLSPRQREVLDELQLGLTNREIADRLGISIATVNKHVHEVLKALKVRNRTQAAAIARKD